MKKTSRLIMLLLAVMVMITALLPANAVFAAEKETVKSAQVMTIGPQRLYVHDPLNSGSDFYTSRSSAARELREAMVARKSTVTIPYKVDYDEMGNEREYIVDMMSDLYHKAIAHTGEPTEGDCLKWCLKKATTSAEYYIKSGYCYIRFTYTLSYYTTAAQEAALTKEVERLVDLLKLDEDISDYQKICNIYGYLTENIKYDYDHLGDSTYLLKHTAYAAAINKKAVCQGYCLLFYRLSLEAGIDARLIAGKGRNEGHAWNIVELDGKYYLLDSTWDAGWTNYSWFLKCESDFSSHTNTMGSEFWESYPLAAQSYSNKKPVIEISANAATGLPMLEWDPVMNAKKYEIWRATSSTGSFTRQFTQISTKYTNTTAVPGKTYYYKVRAIYADGSAGSFSNVKYIMCDCAQPKISVYIKTASGKPCVKWDAVEGAGSYEIYRAASKNGTYTKMYTTTGTSYTNTSAVPGKTYYYKVKAICEKSSYGNSAFSSVKYMTCDCARPVVTIGANSSGKPRLKWDAVSGASKYEVYRSESKNGSYTKMFTTTSVSYTNTTAEAGKTYYFKVRAICERSAYGNSAYSTVKSITLD